MESYYIKGKITLARGEVLPEEATDYLCHSYPNGGNVSVLGRSVELELYPGQEVYEAKFLACVKATPGAVCQTLYEAGITPISSAARHLPGRIALDKVGARPGKEGSVDPGLSPVTSSNQESGSS